jgi:serine/threonine protein kinase/alpha-tubulin suppressor-like RCC1 family protein
MAQPQCPSCGTPVPAGAVVCAKCGTRVGKTLAESVATAMMGPHDTPTVSYKPADVDSTRSESAEGESAFLTQGRIMKALKTATLGDYEILAELGRGGMATVYLAHDVSLDRKVAIKVMSPALLDGEGAIERFKREARTAGALSHPHIIPIHAVRQSGELLYFVMKYVEGRPLDDVVREQGQLPIPMVVQILTEVAGALAYAHRKGVVHRDVKPANIMLDDDGWAVVTDFGIAKVAQQKGLTLTGSTVGTPAYMSPEQCAAKDVTGRSDQYSLGIVGYELLSGQVPFSADSLMGMFMAHMSEAPRPLLEARPDCPPVLARTIERMMAKAPDERWSSLDDVVTSLESMQKPKARESTRLTMAALARVSDGRPRPEDFARPESPTPLNTPPRTSRTVPEVRPAPQRTPRWAWGLAGLPLVALIAWLATKSESTTPPTSTSRVDSTGIVNTPATIPAAGDSLAKTAGAGAQPPSASTSLSTKTAPARDSARLAGANRVEQRPPATGGAQANARATDTAKAPTPTPTSPAPPPITTPTGAAPRTDTIVAVADANAGAPTFSEISAGGSTTCGALSNDAGVICWGAASLTGAKLEGVLFSKIAVGDGHMCGLTPSGEALCWGANSQGQLGDGSTTERAAPTAVRATQRFTEISVGAGHTCALTGDGTAFCWGGNKFGQLGDGSRSNRNRPVLVRSTAGNQGFQSLAAGGSHTCGITRANKAYCWGDGFSGQVGNAMQDFAVEPFAVKTTLAFRSVVAGDRHTCGLTTSGRVYCWGENKQGQLGNETKDDRNVPDSTATDQVFRAIAAGGQHTCGIATSRQLLCWGNNVDGRLGDGTRSSRIVPVVAASGQTFSLVSAGSGHTCALTTRSQAMCWGGNARGQLGGGNTSAFSAAPVTVRIKGGS